MKSKGFSLVSNPQNRHGNLIVNEHYLFHGTKQEFIDKIVNEGLDSRIANDQAMLGPGIYASESPTKADQYTDTKGQRTGGNKTMMLMRVLLGEPFISKSGNPTKYKRAPCKKCFQDRCACKNNECFDSVIDDAGRNFREFVVYSQDMCYPEYIIHYQRVNLHQMMRVLCGKACKL
ncbi:protein mono-ADP-ribosyltransferase PARP12-like [Littorina saxatilis]|uniref:protein mono-ADP-ribosyltransferase PARP12-like n=1 Tax=Littorina saxatilis TaxID=31220 RepID=UPI0038B4A51D